MVDILQVLGGSVGVSIAFLCFYMFAKWHRKEGLLGLARLVALTGFIFLIEGGLKFGWGLGMLETDQLEISAMFTGFNIARTIMLFFIVREILGNRRSIYIFNAYWIMALLWFYKSQDPLKAVDAVSFIFLMFIFLYLALFSDYYIRKAGIIGLAYSILSVAFLVLLKNGVGREQLYFFVADALLFMVVYYIFLDIDKMGIGAIYGKEGNHAKMRKVMTPFRNFATVLFLIIFSLLSTVGMHEIGHAVAAAYYNCGVSSVVLYEENSSPHTEIKCSNPFNNAIITLGGIIATVLIGCFFMLIGHRLTDHIGYLVIGFGFLFGYSDLISIGISDSINALIWFSGMIIMAIGVIKLTSSLFGPREPANGHVSGWKSEPLDDEHKNNVRNPAK